MKWRNILRMSGMTLLACAVLAGNAAAQQKTLIEQLVGAWTLVSSDVTAKDGTKRQEFGANPKGILILDASGRYAVVQSRPDRPKFKASDNIRLDTPAAEFGEAARAFAANFGTWSVNEADKTLIRQYEGALIPNVEGQETKSSISLAGNELKLSTTSPTGLRADTVYKR
jgi:hypothetical protein